MSVCVHLTNGSQWDFKVFSFDWIVTLMCRLLLLVNDLLVFPHVVLTLEKIVARKLSYVPLDPI